MHKKIQDIDFPPEYTCPITYLVLKDPVVTVDGNTYERSAIKAWFDRGNNTSPLNNLNLQSQKVVPNRALKRALESYKQTVIELRTETQVRVSEMMMQLLKQISDIGQFEQTDIRNITKIVKNFKVLKNQLKFMKQNCKRLRKQINNYYPGCIDEDYNFNQDIVASAQKKSKHLQIINKRLTVQNGNLKKEIRINEQKHLEDLENIIKEIQNQPQQKSAWYDEAAKALSQVDDPSQILNIHITQSNYFRN